MYHLVFYDQYLPYGDPPCTMQGPLPEDQYPKTSATHPQPILGALGSPVTNAMAMKLQLLAEIANDIFGTRQVFSAEGNLTPPNGTAGREERVWPGQTCWCFSGVYVFGYNRYTCKDLFERWTLG